MIVILAGLATTACAGVDVIRLTDKTFPSRQVDAVEVLEHEPTRPHIQLAELHTADTWSRFGSMQQRILKKAAALGADAVVFSKPESHVEHQVAYEPTYSPWGYYNPYYGPGWGGYGGPGYGGWSYGNPYGPWGWDGYGGSVAVPYDVTVNSLKGTAIRYTSPE